MARIQILELPEGPGDSQPPFVLVVDEWEPQVSWVNPWEAFGNKIGARAVVVTPETIEIPVAEVTLSTLNEATDGNVVRLRVEPDLSGFREKVEEEVLHAQDRLTSATASADRARHSHSKAPQWCCPEAFQTLGRVHGDDAPTYGDTIPGRAGG